MNNFSLKEFDPVIIEGQIINLALIKLGNAQKNDIHN